MSDDARIRRYCAAAKAMRAGRFDVDVPLGAAGELSELGRALRGLASSLQVRFDEMRALVTLSEKISSGVRLEEVLEHIYESCTTIIPYQRIGLALLEDDDQLVRSRWSRGQSASLQLNPGFAAPLQGSSLQTILQTGRPRILNDLRHYLQQHPKSVSTQLIVQEGYRSSLTFPLVARGKPIGFLFFSSVEVGAYADAHVELFAQIAGQVAVVVEKGELYERLVGTTERLERRNRFIRQTFGRYLDDEVVDRLLDSPQGLDLGGEKRQVTILLSDLRGFTPLAERLPPQQVIDLLNAYLSTMVTVIDRAGGTILEFIGDAILVVFGAPDRRPDDTDRAIACAIEMQRAMPDLNQTNRARGLPQLEMGVALHAGEAIVGNIGSQRRSKYGVVGAAVNLAARLEGCTVGGQILATTEIRRTACCDLALGPSFEVQAKGLAQPIEAFELRGIEGGPMIPNLEDVATLHPLQGTDTLHYRFVETDRVAEGSHVARVLAASARRITVATDRPLRMFSEICLHLDAPAPEEPHVGSYARVIGRLDQHDRTWLLHFTALTPQLRQLIERWLKQQVV